MSNDRLSAVIETVVDSKIEKAMKRGQKKTDTGEYLGRDSNGREWVRLNGSMNTTPIKRSLVEVAKGDIVSVTVGNGYATIDSNISDPAAGLKGTTKTRKTAEKAKEDAKNAIDFATQAKSAATVAQENSVIAQREAANAGAAAQIAYREAGIAQENADIAKGAAESALTDAQVANDAAHAASEDALAAHNAADKALVNLSVIEDVSGTLDWIQKHGDFVATTDTSVQEGTVYFVYDSTSQDYVPIANPDPSANPHDSGWYVLDISSSQTEYIMAHLAVTGRGLWVLPSGLNEGTVTPDPSQDGTGSDAMDNARARLGLKYKMLLSNNGTYIYDGNGNQIALYGPNGIVYDEDTSYHIGSNNAYILYTPASGLTPAKITIGGSNIQLGSSKTLAELLEQVDNTLRFEVSESYNNAKTQVTLTAHVYQGSTEVTSAYPGSSFGWSMKEETDVVPIPIDNGYSCIVNLSDAGYGGTVVCTFSPPNDSLLLDNDDDGLTTQDNEPLTVRSPSGDYVRVADLTVETSVFNSDKLMVSGLEDEHLVTIDTLKGIFGDNDYENLIHKPKIENNVLTGNMTFPELGIFIDAEEQYPQSDEYALKTLEIDAIWNLAMA